MDEVLKRLKESSLEEMEEHQRNADSRMTIEDIRRRDNIVDWVIRKAKNPKAK